MYDKIIIARQIQQVGENKFEVTDPRRRFLPSDQQVSILWRWSPGEGSIGTYVLKGPNEEPLGGKLSISNGNGMLVAIDVSKCYKDSEFVVERYVDGSYKDGEVFTVEVPTGEYTKRSTVVPLQKEAKSERVWFEAGSGVTEDLKLIDPGKRTFREGEKVVLMAKVPGYTEGKVGMTFIDPSTGTETPILIIHQVGDTFITTIPLNEVNEPKRHIVRLSVENKIETPEIELRFLPPIQ